jgi:hypothetical protein
MSVLEKMFLATLRRRDHEVLAAEIELAQLVPNDRGAVCKVEVPEIAVSTNAVAYKVVSLKDYAWSGLGGLTVVTLVTLMQIRHSVHGRDVPDSAVPLGTVHLISPQFLDVEFILYQRTVLDLLSFGSCELI